MELPVQSRESKSPRSGFARIDAHHHLWRYTPEEYGWIDGSMAALRRNFLLDELRGELYAADVAGTVAVQARQTVDETDWLLSLAELPDSPIAGVVGWLPLASPAIEACLAEYGSRAALKGLRHVVQAEPAGFLMGEEFNRGIRAMRSRSLVYDLLVLAAQLPEAIRFVDQHPEQPFVLDHIAKPVIHSGELEPWASDLCELARRPNVTCKLSGMVTEAGNSWSPAQLKRYFDIALEAFGPQRLMIGTDWPVLTLGCSYAEWWQTVECAIAPLSAAEQAAILGGNASRVYGLELGDVSDEAMELAR